jgi:carboxymethylenebutenolidase
MAHETLFLQAADGPCPAVVAKPAAGEGPWPAVIVYMDAFAIRPAMTELAERLAAAGYLVLLPDLFYRSGPQPVFVPEEVFKAGFREVLGPLMAATDAGKAAADTAGFLAYLDGRGDVAGRQVGTVGFCMGGGMALAAAGRFPDRVAAAISFHGGNLATDADSSPHRLVAPAKGEIYVAAAEADSSYPPEMSVRLEEALREAGVSFRAETYAGAGHGWMLSDLPVFDPAAAERGWVEMLGLFGRTLKPA